MKSFKDVHPQLQPVLAASQPWRPDVPLPYPAWVPGPDISWEDATVPTPEGGRQARIYRPAARAGQILPAMLWCHGGGYVAGDIGGDDPLCEQFALGADCCVVSVDYRLAPEYPYPAGLKDCYAALCWMAENAASLSIDPARIAVAGGSAGGGMAASLALLSRDRGGPALCFQMPLYPMLDDRNCTPSSYEILDENFPTQWNRKHNLYAWSCYLKELHERFEDIPCYASPTRADDLHGLPPAFISIGGLDMFRDEAIAYAARLAQADVPVEFHLYPGGYHGFEFVGNPAEIAGKFRNEYIQAMKNALHP